MSKTGRPNHRRKGRGGAKAERHITVRSVRQDPPDLRKLSRAVIALAMAEAEIDTPPATGHARTAPITPTPFEQGGPQ
ncbi:hypothetical protein D4768_21405 [Rhodococcus erythropolis]|uniref:hypothetical protein n=1 Tax=Rhodococcus erythropolis TaxID=1833 RepID=UPI001F1BEA20|nr:hypothetical protein [Rhodococcus erythropolis]UJC79951.1 hypothetical protein D4768_21405 [Rhodococcus erythropolis]